MIFDIYINGLSDDEKSILRYEPGMHVGKNNVWWIQFTWTSDLKNFCIKYNFMVYYSPACKAGELYREVCSADGQKTI